MDAIEIVKTILTLIACHLVGDYVLQSDYIARTKGENLYHLFIHSFLYTLPFYVVFSWNWVLLVIFVMHALIDSLKARWKLIGYAVDQIAHYVVLLFAMVIYCWF